VRRLEETVVTHRRGRAERPFGDVQKQIEVEKDHSPRRWSASA
jgi:hypothetical protein